MYYEHNIITFEIYINYLSNFVSVETIKNYKRLLKILWIALGWNEDEEEDIIKYLNKDFIHIQETIDNLKQSKIVKCYNDSA